MKIKFLHLSKFTFCMGLASVLALPATADVLLAWEGDDSVTGSLGSKSWATNSNASGVEASALTPGAGVYYSNGSENDAWDNAKLRWFTSETLAAGSGTIENSIFENDYFEFNLTPISGNQVSVDSLTLYGSTSNGLVSLDLRSSLDSFGSSLASDTTTSSDQTLSWVLPGTAHDNLTSEVTFRLYGYSVGSLGHTVNIGDQVGAEIILNGAVSVIPEPSSILLLGIAGGLVMLFRRRG